MRLGEMYRARKVTDLPGTGTAPETQRRSLGAPGLRGSGAQRLRRGAMQPEPGSGECDTAAIAVAIKFKNGAPVAAAAVTKGVLLEVKTGGGAALPLFPAGSQAISQPPRARDHKRSCALVSGPGQAGRVAVVVAAMVATAQSGDPERLPWRVAAERGNAPRRRWNDEIQLTGKIEIDYLHRINVRDGAGLDRPSRSGLRERVNFQRRARHNAPGRDVVPVDAPCSLLMSTWREVQDGLEANTYDGREE
ncbi:unnamed protein product [Lampetra fluviatilis]